MQRKITTWSQLTILVLALGMIVYAQEAASVAGTWVMTNQGRGGVVTNTLVLTQDGSSIKGTMKPENGNELTLGDGTVNGKDIAFSVTRQGRNGEVKVAYKGTVEGDTIKGTFQQGQNSVEWAAKRSPNDIPLQR